MSHWINYLPEVGRPLIKRGEAQIELSRRMKQLSDEYERMQRQHEEEKKKLLSDVLQFWTQEEVNAAEAAWDKDCK